MVRGPMPPPVRAVVLVRGARGASPAQTGSAASAVRAVTPAEADIRTAGHGAAIPADLPADADLVLVDGDVRLPAGWFERLSATAHSDSTIATASALSLAPGEGGNGEPVLPPPWTAPPPRLPVSARGCVYVRRSALDLAGPHDAGFDARCATFSLLHVLAPDVTIGSSEATPHAAPEARGEEDPLPTPARRAAQWARAATGRLDVTIDGRALTSSVGGTQVHALELIRALHRTGAVDLRVALPVDPGADVSEQLSALEGVTTLDASTVDQHTPRSSLVHRSHQLSGDFDMLFLRRVGRRVVVTHQDLIGYHNPAYHPRPEVWESFRRLTAYSLAAADLVVACSPHTRRDLLAEDLVPDDRIAVVPLGTDHLHTSSRDQPPELPAGAERIGNAPFLLMLGSDLRHKNRPFAVRLLDQLRRRHGWAGKLVLAGPHVAHGGSREEERDAIAASGTAEQVIDLGSVTEPAKTWLLSAATAVLYPTTYEGFGLVPFEAAAHGRPCLFASSASLSDVLHPDDALLVPWDAAASAARVLPVLADESAARAHAGRIAAAGRTLTWEATATALVEGYHRVLASPPRECSADALAALEAESRYWQLHEDLGPVGISLLGRSGLLPEEAQRTLAALAGRRARRRLLLGGLAGIRRAAFAVSRTEDPAGRAGRGG